MFAPNEWFVSSARALRKTFKSVSEFAWNRLRRISVRWTGILAFAFVLVLIGVWFVYATVSAWNVQTSAGVNCATPFDPTHPLAYIQYSIKDQDVEPYFRGSIFISLGDVSTGPLEADVLTTGGGKYGTTSTHVEFRRDEQSKTFWMTKEAENIAFVRESGSHRDFPFDSATIDLDTTFKPTLPISFVMVRNFNSSFYIPCDRVKVSAVSPDKIHLHFQIRRNPLVQLMAVVMLIAATLFVLIIPFAVKRDALPTSVASFFFSIWSIRGILSSEMKVFPTRLDMAILFLSVLLLLLIGVRVLRHWMCFQQSNS
jgi:hypothetical protein